MAAGSDKGTWRSSSSSAAASTSGFMLFCNQRRGRQENRGKDLKTMVEESSRIWEVLPEAERDKYRKVAKSGSRKKVAPGPSSPAAKAMAREMALTDIERMTGRAWEQGNLTRMRFHILHVNHWLKTDVTPTGSSSLYGVFPAEIGLVELTVSGGLEWRYNQMVEAGPVPMGYKGDMRSTSERSHGMWQESDAPLSANYRGILESIRKVVRAKHDWEMYAGQSLQAWAGGPVPPQYEAAMEHRLLPIYVMPELEEICVGALKWLGRRAGAQVDWVVYQLPDLLLRLMQLGDSEGACSGLTVAKVSDLLRRDVFSYTEGVSCEFHSVRSNRFCAGGAASRLGYIVCDFCCQLFRVRPKEGYHVPEGVRVEAKDLADLHLDEDDLCSDSASVFSWTVAGSVNNDDADSVVGSDASFYTAQGSIGVTSSAASTGLQLVRKYPRHMLVPSGAATGYDEDDEEAHCHPLQAFMATNFDQLEPSDDGDHPSRRFTDQVRWKTLDDVLESLCIAEVPEYLLGGSQHRANPQL